MATPKDLLNEVHSKGKSPKPYFVNLTFWEDRPRLNLWEQIIQQRRKLDEEEQAQKEAQIKVKLNYIKWSRILHCKLQSDRKNSPKINFLHRFGLLHFFFTYFTLFDRELIKRS